MSILFTRREALAMIAAAAPAALSAQGASQLPLRTSGLEHVGFTVPDPQKSAAFYGRIFDPQIFQEMMPPLRYYCRLGIGYVAFGPNPSANPNAAARIDHFCAMVEDYRLDEMRAELKTHGLNLVGQPGFNAVTDPDGADRTSAGVVTSECQIEVVEPAGSDTFAITHLGGKEVVARLRADAKVSPGKTAKLAFNLDKAVFFDPGTEQRIA